MEGYGIADRHRDWDPERFYPCIFYRKDSLEILESGDLWLSETPEVHASKSWGSAFPRLATWARCRSRDSRTELLFACTHMDHISAEARCGQARVLKDFLERGNSNSLPIILVGDFNDVPESAPYQTLTSSSRPSGLRTLSAIERWALGNKIFQRQQQLQQLQMVSSLSAGLTFNQTESSFRTTQ